MKHLFTHFIDETLLATKSYVETSGYKTTCTDLCFQEIITLHKTALKEQFNEEDYLYILMEDDERNIDDSHEIYCSISFCRNNKDTILTPLVITTEDSPNIKDFLKKLIFQSLENISFNHQKLFIPDKNVYSLESDEEVNIATEVFMKLLYS